MIKKMTVDDIEDIMRIWLDENIKAHNFISKCYWVNNYNAVREVLLDAEVYCFKSKGLVLGFIGLNDDYIEGIFVDFKHQHKGIGRKLLNYVKSIKSSLGLSVYEKNAGAIQFYRNNDFEIVFIQNEDANNEIEYIMKWSRNKDQKSNR